MPSVRAGHGAICAAMLWLAPAACTPTVKVEPIKIEPIDITLRVYLKADEKLDSFFKDVDAPGESNARPAPGAGAGPQGAKP